MTRPHLLSTHLLSGTHLGCLGLRCRTETSCLCLLRSLVKRANALLHPWLLRGLLRHLDGLLPLANSLAKAGLLRCLLSHDRGHHGIGASALQALEGLTEIRGTRLLRCAHGLAKSYVLRKKPRLLRRLRSHANGLLTLANAIPNHLIGLVELRLRTLELAGRLSHQSLRAPEVCRTGAQRQLLRLSQTANTLSDR